MNISRIILTASMAAALAGIATAASATPAVETLTWSGNLTYGQEGSTPQFGGTANSSLVGDPFTIALSFDPTAASDGCGLASNNFCSFVLGAGGAKEVVTINGITHPYTATSGNYGLGVGGGSNDQINFTANGGSGFGLNVNDGSGLFGGSTNANFIGFNFTNVAVTGTFGDSSLNGIGSLGGNVTSLSATFTPAVTSVPEPATIALFGAGLAGAVMRRRRRTARA